MFCKLCKRTSDVFTHLCSNDYADQKPQCVIRNASRSIMLLTTHKHDSKIINKSDPTKTCATCGENKFPLRGRCEGFTFPTNGPRYPRSRQQPPCLQASRLSHQNGGSKIARFLQGHDSRVIPCHIPSSHQAIESSVVERSAAEAAACKSAAPRQRQQGVLDAKRSTNQQSSEVKPPPPPLAPASAANLVHCMTFFDSFFDSFSILHFFA